MSAGVGAVSVVLCDDAHITTLNATHRGKAAPTDVLSFELEDDLDYKVRIDGQCWSSAAIARPWAGALCSCKGPLSSPLLLLLGMEG
eukprot:1145033-Pelagomonas_calceolata.AAC.2